MHLIQVFDVYPFSHNHGSVENYLNERKMILEIFQPFSTKKNMIFREEEYALGDVLPQALGKFDPI